MGIHKFGKTTLKKNLIKTENIKLDADIET